MKHGVATDEIGDKIAWQGSNNETAEAWFSNYEEFWVSPGWESGWSAAQVKSVEDRFQLLWDDEHDDWITLPIPDAARQRLLDFRPDQAPTADPKERPKRPPMEVPDDEAVIAAWLRDAPHLLGVGDRVGRATAAIRPWPHQTRVANGVVGTYPQRYLLADEVGLGKTIEVGLALRDLVLSGTAERCLILAPKSVLVQWQDELREKFSLMVPIYDGRDLIWPRPRRLVEQLHGRQPWDEASILLVSSQLVKRKERRAAATESTGLGSGGGRRSPPRPTQGLSRHCTPSTQPSPRTVGGRRRPAWASPEVQRAAAADRHTYASAPCRSLGPAFPAGDGGTMGRIRFLLPALLRGASQSPPASGIGSIGGSLRRWPATSSFTVVPSIPKWLARWKRSLDGPSGISSNSSHNRQIRKARSSPSGLRKTGRLCYACSITSLHSGAACTATLVISCGRTGTPASCRATSPTGSPTPGG